MVLQIDDLTILYYPHPALRRPAKAIEAVTDEVRAVAAQMLELMNQARGVGLAAPQVGVAWRLFVASPIAEPGGNRIFINPTLSQPSRQTNTREEGCLSIPHVNGEITRPASITIDALDEHGKPLHIFSNDLAARVWQHEADHLDGVLIIDRMTSIDRIANRQALRELELAAKR